MIHIFNEYIINTSFGNGYVPQNVLPQDKFIYIEV